MRKQDLEITISPTGEVAFVVKGMAGKGCLDETKFLEAALGNAVVEREMTSEYYAAGASASAADEATLKAGEDE